MKILTARLSTMRASALIGITALSLTAAGCTPATTTSVADGETAEIVEISMLTYSADGYDALNIEMIAAFQEEYPNVKVNLVYQPGGGEGDNLLKTKLATGEMEDLFLQATGAQLASLQPDQNLVNLADEAWIDDMAESFIEVVDTEMGIYGAPYGTMMGGMILYNKPVYQELELKIPVTWDEFMENNQVIKDSGIAAPIIQTYEATWSSQLFVLGDFANVSAVDPGWADKFTANEVRTAEQPAVQSWLNQQVAFEAGFFNVDYASATFEDGMRMLALGEGVHYPMLSGALDTLFQNFPENTNDIGGFAIPAQKAEDTTLTVWPPNALYIPTTTVGAKREAALAFLAFISSEKGCAVQNEFGAPTGPYVFSCVLPDTVPSILKDLQVYFDENRASPALEFVSPIKGPNLEFITVEVGSGIRSGAEGAALYDEDVKKQAQQLGLEGW